MLGLGLGVNRGGFVPSLPLLDVYTGAAAAYSLRKLRTDYTGAAIRVRESATNTEADIGFNADGTLNTTALLAHVGANNGFVTTWYDQSGNARNATQAVLINQPQIVSSGSVVLENSKPTLQFDGSSDTLFYVGNFLGTSAGSGFSVSSFDNATRAQREIIYGLQDVTGTRYDFLLARQSSASVAGTVSNGIDFYIEGDFQQSVAGAITNTNQRIFSAIYSNGVRRIVYSNGVALSTYTNVSLGLLDDATHFYIGQDINGGSNIDGAIQEIVIYPTDQSANRTAIESNINAYYNIY